MKLKTKAKILASGMALALTTYFQSLASAQTHNHELPYTSAEYKPCNAGKGEDMGRLFIEYGGDTTNTYEFKRFQWNVWDVSMRVNGLDGMILHDNYRLEITKPKEILIPKKDQEIKGGKRKNEKDPRVERPKIVYS